MNVLFRCGIRRIALTLLSGILVAVSSPFASQSATAQHTQVFSFESPDVEGFVSNGGLFPVVQDTIGATDGEHSLKVSVPSGATFVGALTNTLPLAIGNPGSLGAGINYVDFDLTITQVFGPPPPAASGFAVVGVTIFSSTQDGTTTGIPVQFRNEFHVDGLAADTYHARVYLINAHPYGPEFLNDGFSFNEIYGDVDTLVPNGFQFFVNKTGSSANHPLTFYIDNVVVGLSVQGDYNGNGVVDAADYTVWRNNLGKEFTVTPTPADGDGDGDGEVTIADYEYWKARFGMTEVGAGAITAAAVPEPITSMLVFTMSVFLSVVRRDRISR